MADPTIPLKQVKTDSAENQAEFLVENRMGIMQKLRRLSKANCMVTATFNGGAQTMNTAVIEVIRDMDLIALDYGPNDAINKQLLAAERIIFKAELEGIDVQFTATSITKAKFQGQPVFAVPIPDSILWIQRRQSYRVHVPMGVPAHIELGNDTPAAGNYQLMDISAGGLSIQDKAYRLNLENGEILHNCRLFLAGHGDGEITLEVKNRFPINRTKREAGQRLGCAFVNLNMSFGAIIQRYIHALELLNKRTDE